MGVAAGTGLLFGTLIFLGVGIVAAVAFAFYVRQKTRDGTMTKDNAK